MGYQVRFLPSRWSEVFALLGRRKSVVVLNWFEDRAALPGPAIWMLLKSLLLLAIVRLSFRRVVWVRHNLRPHNQYSALVYRSLLGLLPRLADKTVTHRPVPGMTTECVPHPLYTCEPPADEQERDIAYLCFGAIKPYKQIDQLLKRWPASRPLVIAGVCVDAAHEAHIRSVIAERKLNVQWSNRFLDYEELCQLLGRTRFVVLAHLDRSMIVSGTFFHAISLGANVLVRDGDFYRHYLKDFSSVTPFTLDSLESDLLNATALPAAQVRREAEERLSGERCAEQWKAVLSGG